MVTFEQVEKLREYANVSYDEARAALENADGDMLQAIIGLEHQGRIKTAKGSKETFKECFYGKGQSEGAFKGSMNRFWTFTKGLVHKGNVNSLVVERNDERVLKLPVTVLIIVTLCAFWVVVPLLAVGLFFNFRYFFAGPDLGANSVNNALMTASTTAEGIKRDIQNK